MIALFKYLKGHHIEESQGLTLPGENYRFSGQTLCKHGREVSNFQPDECPLTQRYVKIFLKAAFLNR